MELDFREDPSVLGAIVDAMPVGIFTVDALGRFVAWSDGAERITGYPSAEVVGRPCELLEGPGCKGFRTVADLLAGDGPLPEGICNQECKVLARDGGERYLHGSVRVLAGPDGAALGAVGAFVDLTSFMAANERLAFLESRVDAPAGLERMVGGSAGMRAVFRAVRLAASSEATVLVTGESGTGKELAARAIHALGPRRAGPFLAVNCGGLPEALLESELFGHVKGAFTGAVRDHVGLFQAAERGTLFLDEVGDVSVPLQTKLLRVLEERAVRPVGATRASPIDVRIIAATNKDLGALVLAGTMREDFYYRIHVFPIEMPPLRERRDDIPLLADHLRRDLARTTGKEVKSIARDALAALVGYDWPGNVRELRNAIEHAFVTVAGDTIHLLDLPAALRAGGRAGASASPPPDARRAPRGPTGPARSKDDDVERRRIEQALAASGGVRAKAAKLLGYSRVTLWKKLKRLGLDREPE